MVSQAGMIVQQAVLSGVGGAVVLGALHAIALRLPGSRKIAAGAAGRPVLACAASTLLDRAPVKRLPRILNHVQHRLGGAATSGRQRRINVKSAI